MVQNIKYCIYIVKSHEPLGGSNANVSVKNVRLQQWHAEGLFEWGLLWHGSTKHYLGISGGHCP